MTAESILLKHAEAIEVLTYGQTDRASFVSAIINGKVLMLEDTNCNGVCSFIYFLII